MDVYVETWLSEEQYQLAKDRNELAWQSPRNSVVDLPALTEVPVSNTYFDEVLSYSSHL